MFVSTWSHSCKFILEGTLTLQLEYKDLLVKVCAHFGKNVKL